MFQLTREVRFTINANNDGQLQQKPTNSYGGYPSLNGLGYCFICRVTVSGEPDAHSSYLLNIRDIDAAVRQRGISVIEPHVRHLTYGGGGHVVRELFDVLRDAWNGATLERVELALNPWQSLAVIGRESPMIRLSQKFEFAATHRLNNPNFSDAENRRIYGKCSNPHGHGHNYELEVTLRGDVDQAGVLIDVPSFERIVGEHVIELLDHRNLNVEVPQFKKVIPSVENIARVIHDILRPLFAERAKLASVTVWETPKTWCRYSELPEESA